MNSIRRALVLFPFLAALYLPATEAAPGDVYYVDKNNASASDSNPGSEERPWKTIQKAASTLAAGETVLVKEGAYTELFSGGPTTNVKAIKPMASGREGLPITYKAYPGHKVVIDQQDVGTGFYIFSKSYITIDGFEIKNATVGGVRTTDGCSNIIVENNYIHHIDGGVGDNIAGVRFDHVQHSAVRNNVIHTVRVGGVWYGNASGIVSYDGAYITVENNEFYDVPNGVYHKRSAGLKGMTIRRNIFHDVGRAAYYAIGGAGDAPHIDQEFYENVVYKASTALSATPNETRAQSKGMKIYNNVLVAENAGIHLRGYAGVEIWNNIISVTGASSERGNIVTEKSSGWPTEISYSDYNLFSPSQRFILELYGNKSIFDTLAGWRSGTGFDGSSKSSDPLFMNEGSRDYRLSASSPALKVGRNGEDLGAYPTGTGTVGPVRVRPRAPTSLQAN